MSKAHWLALTSISGVGGVTVRRLIERFGSVEEVFDAPDDELLQVSRITPDVIAQMHAISLENLESDLASMSYDFLQVLTWDDDDYPENLRSISDAPPLLFVLGDMLRDDARAVAIVGTREPSPPRLALAEMMARELSGRGVTIVSGLALGIDSAAHRGALLADGGRTLAVLGSGMRAIHPRENVPLAEEIATRGALISEFLPNTPARGQNLMARDRIISGLSLAVIVIEAGIKSGTLDTAAKAQRQGRALFAVPGSPGTDALLSAGATLLDSQHPDYDGLVERLMTRPRSPTEMQLSLWA
jgi:DNA processing protein